MTDAALTVGNIPPLYAAVYDTLCPDDDLLDRVIFMGLHENHVSRDNLSKIWDMVESSNGYLTRNGYYKVLALIALSQQGKSISDKVLAGFEGKDLPVPSLGDIYDLKACAQRLRRERNPCLLSMSYKDLTETDTITVNLLSEKKGFIVKHNEYEIYSRRFDTGVNRRYSDFHALRQMLIQRYPYRIIPPLPPKRLLSQIDKGFLDVRRRQLHHFLAHMARHPVICDDEILRFFLTFEGTKVDEHIKELFKNIPDEFMTNEFAPKAKDLVAVDTAQQVEHSRTHLLAVFRCVLNLRDLADRMQEGTRRFSEDMQSFSQLLRTLGENETPVTTWATGGSRTWSRLQSGLKGTADKFGQVADKAGNQALAERDGIVDQLDLFLALLQGYKELLERHEKGVLTDHKSAIQKMSGYKRRQMLATVGAGGSGGASAAEQFEARIIKHEVALADLENRNYFSLFCLHLETQVIHANLDLLYFALLNMVKVNLIGHREMGEVWQELRPLVESMLPSSTANSPTSPSAPKFNSNEPI